MLAISFNVGGDGRVNKINVAKQKRTIMVVISYAYFPQSPAPQVRAQCHR